MTEIGTSTFSSRLPSMKSYSYSLTDLDAFESEAIEVELESEEVVDYGAGIGREMLRIRPDLKDNGMCVVMYDTEGIPFSIVPVDTIQ